MIKETMTHTIHTSTTCIGNFISDEYNAYNRSAFAAFQYGGAGVDLDDDRELYYMHYEPCITHDIPEHEC